MIAPILFLPGLALFKSLLLAAGVALLGLILTTLIWTRARTHAPAMVLDENGVKLEGWPLLPWREISGVKRGADPLGRPALLLRLTRAAPERVRSPLWRAISPRELIVHAALLDDGIDAIEDAFGFFLKRA